MKKLVVAMMLALALVSCAKTEEVATETATGADVTVETPVDAPAVDVVAE